MSRSKEAFLEREPDGYPEMVFSKDEEIRFQKYLDEIERIKINYLELDHQ